MSVVRRARLTVLLLVCTSACGDDPSKSSSRCGDEHGTVTRVLDGDTVELKDSRHIRYLLVDAPEIAHNSSEVADCFGDEARELNETFVLNEHVRFEYDTECEDRYGRTLAYVWLGDTMINRTLLERGYARLLVIAPNDRYKDDFAEVQQDAEDTHAGLWGVCE